MIPLGILASATRLASPPSSTLAGLIASLGPVTWLRLNDNAATPNVIDSAPSPGTGKLYKMTNGLAPVELNTDTVSTAGLVSGDADKAFDFGGGAMVTSTNRVLADHIGWTVFCIIRPESVAANSGVGAVFQLSGNGASVPELDIMGVSPTTFRFRLMRSGTAEVGMDATPSWAYGSRLSVCVKKEVSGRAKIFVNGSLVSTSSANPSFNGYTDPLRWGNAQFGSTSYYPFPGVIDEPAVFDRPLSDEVCETLTSFG